MISIVRHSFQQYGDGWNEVDKDWFLRNMDMNLHEPALFLVDLVFCQFEDRFFSKCWWKESSVDRSHWIFSATESKFLLPPADVVLSVRKTLSQSSFVPQQKCLFK